MEFTAGDGGQKILLCIDYLIEEHRGMFEEQDDQLSQPGIESSRYHQPDR